MIGYLKGKIKSVETDRLILEANNVGWEVFMDTTEYLEGVEVELFIYTQVKETEISLWGFKNNNSLRLFKLLINISGVGTKTAMHLINNIGVNGIYSGIAMGDATKLKVPGIGKKTSEKIIIELKDKLELIGSLANSKELPTNATNGKLEEVKDALLSLGYRQYDISKVLDKLANNIDIQKHKLEDIIKEVLKQI